MESYGKPSGGVVSKASHPRNRYVTYKRAGQGAGQEAASQALAPSSIVKGSAVVMCELGPDGVFRKPAAAATAIYEGADGDGKGHVFSAGSIRTRYVLPSRSAAQAPRYGDVVRISKAPGAVYFNQDVRGLSERGRDCGAIAAPADVVYRESLDQVMPGQDVLLCVGAGDRAGAEPTAGPTAGPKAVPTAGPKAVPTAGPTAVPKATKFVGMTSGGHARFAGLGGEFEVLGPAETSAAPAETSATPGQTAPGQWLEFGSMISRRRRVEAWPAPFAKVLRPGEAGDCI
jgi:hypothetical protein